MRVFLALLLCAALLAGCFPSTPRPVVTTTPLVKLSPPKWGECDPLVQPAGNAAANPTPKVVVVREIKRERGQEPPLSDASEPGQEPPLRTAFVDGSLIVTGFGSDISNVIQQVNAELGDKVPRGLVWRGEQWLVPPQSNPVGLETRLYQFTPTSDINAVEIATIARRIAIDQNALVFADPNLVAFANAEEQCALEGSPLSGEGSPLSGEGSPLSGEGSPLGVPGGIAQVDLFWRQWAFGKGNGIDLSDGAARRANLSSAEGSEIIIFDTSPFTRTGEVYFEGSDWQNTDLRICVEHPVPVSLSDTPACRRKLANESDHGVFVAGLADAVAPAARLRLVRVLDDHGRGELQDFLYALGHLQKRDLRGTVLNLSLGFLPTTTRPVAPIGDLCAKAGLRDCAGFLELLAKPDRPAWLVKELVDQDGITLFIAIRSALDAGAVISAAAGNYGNGSPARPAQLPAAYANGNPTLLAVAGTTSKGARAFYSHAGTLAAPGGGNTANRCQAGASPDCNAGLDSWIISVARHQENTANEYWSYGAWIGTSFSTPLVSGEAALELAAGADPAKAADKVKASVTAPATPDPALGAGILRMP